MSDRVRARVVRADGRAINVIQRRAHLYQRRAGCCRYDLFPQGDLCASCPPVPHERRLEPNLEWLKTQLERRAKAGGHG